MGAGPRGETVATGDAMNVAARLDGAGRRRRDPPRRADARPRRPARPGRAARAAQRARPPGERRARSGCSTCVPRCSAPLGSATGPFVGREHERAELRDLLARAAAERACHLVTVSGPPGIGKSRLAQRVRRRRRGRGHGRRRPAACPTATGSPTGRWPTSSASSSGADPEHGIAELLAGEDVTGSIARRVLGAIGLADEPGAGQRDVLGRPPAVRGRARASAPSWRSSRTRTGPSRRCSTCSSTSSPSRAASPILLVCLARPEFLLERTPRWAAAAIARVLPLERAVRRRGAGLRPDAGRRRAEGRHDAADRRDRRGQPAVPRAARRRGRRGGSRERCRRASRPCSRRASTGSSRTSGRCSCTRPSRAAASTAASVAALMSRERDRRAADGARAQAARSGRSGRSSPARTGSASRTR